MAGSGSGTAAAIDGTASNSANSASHVLTLCIDSPNPDHTQFSVRRAVGKMFGNAIGELVRRAPNRLKCRLLRQIVLLLYPSFQGGSTVNHVRIVLLAGAALWAPPAIAAEALKFAPPPAWVHPQPLPAAKPTAAPVAVLLEDQQIAFERGKVTSYTDDAIRIQNAQGLAAGNLAIVWQPATDTVTVNKLQIRRGDKVIDVLAGGQTFTVLRRETNLDAATLDGTLTATIQPEGLQEGDILEMATTIERSDPVLKGHVEAMFGAWNGLPIQSAHAAVKWPSELHVNVRQTPNLPAARKSSANGMNALELSGENVEPLVLPGGAPGRFLVGRLAEATDFGSWSDLANLMLPLFRDASAIPASGLLHDEVEKIRGPSSDPKGRAAGALALVQDRVRYVALLMGQGGYVPASAEQTWSRRFGDCKAKTALLLGILHALGIEAEPVLVQAKLGDMIADRLPMISLFNHVLVRAHIGGKDYWLDGTRTGDADLDSIKIPDFAWGLPLVQRAELVRMIPRPLDLPNIEHRVNIDAGAGLFAAAPTTIDELYRGDSAVAFNTLYSALTAQQRDEAMRDKAKTYFDDFSVASSSIAFDKAKRELSVSIKGAAKLSWKDGWFNVPTSSIGFAPDFDRAAGPLHDAPLAVTHPRYVKDRATIRLPAGFAAKQKLSAPVHEALAGVEYARLETVSGDVLTVDSSERSIASEVPYKDAIAAEARLRALNKDDIYLSSNVSYLPTGDDLTALAATTPGSADEYVQRGNSYLDGTKYDQAIADFTAALKLEPENRTALADRAIARVWKRQFEEAEKDLSVLDRSDPKNSVGLRARGLIAQFKGECARAIEFYTQSLAREPGNTFALGNRAYCEAQLSKSDAALADSADALEGDPGLGELRIMRANIFMRQGKRDLVAGEAEALTRDNPDSEYAWVGAGKAYAALGQRDKAMQALDRALKIGLHAYVYVNRAHVRPPSDVEGRLADLNAALKLEPSNSDALTEKARILTSKGDTRGALALIDKLSPALDNQDRLERAVLLYKAGRTDEGRKILEAVRTSSKTSMELNNLCWTKATADVMLDSALQDCRDALKLNPESGPSEDSLGMVLLKLGKLDEALQAYDKAIARNTGPVSLMGRALVYLKKGDRTRAETDAAEARKLSPTIDDTFAGYGLKFDTKAAAATAAK